MYTNACHQSGIPKLIHSDNNPTYFSNSIKRFFKAHEIKFSKTGSDKNANQVSEYVNSRLKANLLLSIHNEDRKMKAVQIYNQELTKEPDLKFRQISRGDFEYYNTSIFVSDLQKAKESAEISPLIKKDNAQAALKVKSIHEKIQNSELIPDNLKKEMIDNIAIPQAQYSLSAFIEQLGEYIIPSNQDILDTLKLLSYQAAENTKLLMEQSERLSSEITDLKDKNVSLVKMNHESQKILQELKDYKIKIENTERQKQELKRKRQDRKRRQENDPILEEDYKIIINYITHSFDGSELKKARFRILSTLLFLTGGAYFRNA